MASRLLTDNMAGATAGHWGIQMSSMMKSVSYPWPFQAIDSPVGDVSLITQRLTHEPQNVCSIRIAIGYLGLRLE